MKRAPLATLAGALALLAAACSDPPKPPAPDAGPPPGGLTNEQAARVVAKVGDRTITLGDFATTLDRMDQYDRLRYQAPERRKDLLNQMVDVELLAMEAKRRGLDQDPEAQEAIRQTLRDALLADTRLGLPTPTDIPAEDVKAYYDAHIADYREPEKRRLSAIVLDDEKRAKDLLETAKKATDSPGWSKLFFENSLNAPKEHLSSIPVDLAGDLGIVGPPGDPKTGNERIPEPVRAAAFKLAKVGDVYGEIVAADAPVSPGGPEGHRFFIVRLNGMTPGHESTLAEADKTIRVILLKQRTADLEDKLEQELRTKFKVEIDDAELAKLAFALPGEPPPQAPAPSAAPSVATPTSASAAPSSSASPKKP